MPTLRQLEVFVTTAEYKKMSLAAKHLFISQPTISQIISDLEAEYNVELFMRQKRELQITAAGEILLESAKKMLSINDTLTQDMKNIHFIRPLRIAATMTIGSNIIAQIIKDLIDIYPDIDPFVKVTNTAHIELLLLRNELDVALSEGVITHPEIVSTPAFVDDLCIICSTAHPLAQKKRLTINDLSDQSFILREKGSGTRAIFEKMMKEQHLSYQIKWESASTSAIIDAVSKNLGLGFVSKRSAYRYVNENKIHICALSQHNLQRFFYICTYKNHPFTSQMNDFIKFIESLPDDYQEK